eukprot:3936601-Lingulodinium_polyedra.AAC.1
MEDLPIKKATELVSNHYMGKDIKCNGCHTHVQLRGHGAGGSRTAQVARCPPALCELILQTVAETSARAGG